MKSIIVITFINIKNLKNENTLIFGVLSIMIGIMLLAYPSSLNILISLSVGMWYVVSSATRMKFAVLLRKVPEINWILILIGSALTLIIGLTFIFTPLISAVALTEVSGIMMIVYSIIDIIEILFIKKHIKAVEKVLE